MARFCGNCGKPLEEGAKVCGYCGTPVDENSARIPLTKTVDPERNRKLRKMGKIVAVLLILVVSLMIIVNIFSNFLGRKGLINKAMKAYMNYDIETLVTLSSDIYSYGILENAAEIYFENKVEQDLDFYESEAGHDYKIRYEINDIYDLSEWKTDERRESIASTYPEFDIDEIKKISEVDVTVFINGDQSFTRDLRFLLSKEDDGWRILFLE